MKCQTAHFLVVTRIMACEIAFGISPALFQLPIFHQNGQPEDLQTCFKGVEGLKLYNLQTKHTRMNSSGKFDIFIYLFFIIKLCFPDLEKSRELFKSFCMDNI